MQPQNSLVEECRKALENCPHEQGTVTVMCRVCLGQGSVFAYDIDQAEYLSIDCMNRSVEAYALTPGGPLGGGASTAELLSRIRPVPIEVQDLDPLETELRHVLALRDDPHRSWAESATALEALRAAERIGRLTAPLTPQGVTA